MITMIIRKNIFEWLVAILIYLSIPPSFMWHIDAREGVLFLCVLLLSIFYSLFSRLKIQIDNLKFVIFLSIIFFYIALKDDSSIFGLINKTLLPYILVVNSAFSVAVINKFIKIYSIFLIPSIVVYFLVVLLGIPLPYDVLDAVNTTKDYSYIQYPFLVTIDDPLNIGYYRFMSWFDEPGVVGSVSGILLMVKGLEFNKWETYVLLFSGFLSLSMAFFVILSVYIFLFQNSKVKLVAAVILCTLIIICYSNDIISYLLLDRFNFENGTFAGMNRTSDKMDLFMKDFLRSDRIWFGYGHNYSQTVVNAGGASFKDLIVNYGLIPFIGLLLSTILYAVSKLKLSKELIVYIFMWFAIIYQRPFITLLFYFFLLYFPLYILEGKKNSSE